MIHLNNAGYSLIENTICTSIAIVISVFCMQYIFFITATQAKIQAKFTTQNAKLITKHFVSIDLHTAMFGVYTCKAIKDSCNNLITLEIAQLIKNKTIKPLSDLLIIHTVQEQIVYYLRRSVVPNTPQNVYALYRDNIKLNAQALVENITDLNVELTQLDATQQTALITIYFSNTTPLEIECGINNNLATH